MTSVGPSEAKADYSNYGVEQASVAAPGGWFRDYFGTPRHRVVENQTLSALPEWVARHDELIDENGVPTTPSVVRDCRGGTCAYYIWIQGTSMAAPQVTGTAAVVASVTGLRGQALRDRILSTADDLGTAGYDTKFGAGRLNTYRAVTSGSLAGVQ